MEQYAHLLISADPNFAPDPAHVAAFFDLVQKNFRFQYVKSPKDWMPGLRVYNSAEVERKAKNVFTGEERSFKVPKWFDLGDPSEIPSFIAGEPNYGLIMSGKWSPSDVPIQLLMCDGKAFEGDLICTIACAGRPNAVCTGDWWGEDRKGECEFGFNDPNGPFQSTGVFTHPWTGKRIEVANAGTARFWLEFEFGKWLIPRMDDSFDVLQPQFLNAVENCIGTRLVQAGRATG